MLLKIPKWILFGWFVILFIVLMPIIGFSINPNLKYFTGERLSGQQKLVCLENNSINCESAYIFKKANKTANQILVPGISFYPQKVFCFKENILTEIKVSSFSGRFNYIENNSADCDGEIVSALTKDDTSNISAWNYPFLLVGQKESMFEFFKSLVFYLNDLRSFIGVLAIFQFTLMILFSKILGSTLSFSYLNSFYVTVLMALFNSKLLEQIAFINLNKYTSQIVVSLAYFWIVSFSLFNGNKKRSNFIKGLVFVGFITILTLCTYIPSAPRMIFIMIGFSWMLNAYFKKFSLLSSTLFILNNPVSLALVVDIIFVPRFAGSLFFLIYCLGLQYDLIKTYLIKSKISEKFQQTTSKDDLFLKIESARILIGLDVKLSVALIENDQYQITTFSKNGLENNHNVGTKSKVISSVIATSAPLIHIDSNKFDISNHGNYSDNIFSAYPILVSGKLFGVICFSNYQKYFTHVESKSLFENIFSDLTAHIGNSLNQTFDATFNLVKNEIESISDSTSADYNEYAKNIGKALFNGFGISIYFAEINSENLLNVTYATGAIEDKIDEINNQKFRITDVNHFGAVPLAINSNQVIIQQNWKLLGDGISKGGVEFYKSTNTNSIIAIPISVSVSSRSLKYVMWLQSDYSLTFTQNYKTICELIKVKLETLILNKLTLSSQSSVLSYLSVDMMHSLAKGESVKIEENGWIAMLDLRRSTYLREILDKVIYLELMNLVHKEFSQIMNKFDFELQSILGDASIYTLKTNNNNFNTDELLVLAGNVNEHLKKTINEHSNTIVFSKDDFCFRICLNYGDISRDLQDGVGGGWTVIGSTMSFVHKIESIAKSNPNGVLFFTTEDGVVSISTKLRTNSAAWSNGPEVVYISKVA